MVKVSVLRLNHRKQRDKRVTTHVFLSARALGAHEGFLSGEEDDSLVSGINETSKRWGGSFRVKHVRNWRELLKKSKEKKVHLTMYGTPIQEAIGDIRTHKSLMVIVGGAKVPGDVYSLSDYNISVTSQPHSEISSLAVFLHEFFRGEELKKSFKKARIIVKPEKSGKHVIKKD